MPDDLSNCNTSLFPVHLQGQTARAVGPDGAASRALLALRQLLATLPLPNSNPADMRRHERDHAILTAERGPAAAEAVMWNVYAFEHWRRNRSAP